MATTTISGSGTDNNNGTVLLGGNVSSTGPITNAPDKSILGAGAQDQPGPQESAYVGAQKSNAAGTFADQDAGEYIVLGSKIKSDLGDVANTVLDTPAADHGQRASIHKITTRKTVLIDSWNYATGEPTYNGSNPSDDDFGSDHAASPTRAIPGELVFLQGSKTPSQLDYSAITGS